MADMRTTTGRKVVFGSGASSSPDWRKAIDEAADAALAPLGGERPDLAVFFTTPLHAQREAELGARLQERLHARTLAGVTAAAVIGGGREIEEGPGLSVFVGRIPGVEPRAFAVPAQEDHEPPLEAWRSAIPAEAGERGIALLFADPFTLDVGAFVDSVNENWPEMPVAGGIASGGTRPGMNRLYLDDEVHEAGAVGIFLAGAVDARTVVSQGCRPIGKHLVVTKAKGNIIQTLGGRPALQVLREVVAGLPPADQKLAGSALHVGRVIDERRETFGRGDFLIRNPIGADPESGALAVADHVRAGQTIQFHVRDGAAADEDLRHLLGPGGALEGASGRHAALLFSCNGRGKRFFGVDDHDTGVIRELVGEVPVAGFFCGGEFGPIGGKNFVHGYTSTIVLF